MGTSTRPTVAAAGTAPRPTLKDRPTLADRAPLRIVAQASRPAAGHVLVIHVDVRDGEGAPVTDLGKDDFTILELPGGISDLPAPLVIHLGTGQPKRKGLYQVLFQAWDPPNPGVIAYHVRVAAGARLGVAMTSIYVAPAD